MPDRLALLCPVRLVGLLGGAVIKVAQGPLDEFGDVAPRDLGGQLRLADGHRRSKLAVVLERLRADLGEAGRASVPRLGSERILVLDDHQMARSWTGPSR